MRQRFFEGGIITTAYEGQRLTGRKQYGSAGQEGAFGGSLAAVRQVKKDALMISARMFGREMQVKVPEESVKRLSEKAIA